MKLSWEARGQLQQVSARPRRARLPALWASLAGVMTLALAPPALGHGAGSSPSAGGGAIGEVVFGTIGTLIVLGSMLALVIAHRRRRTGLLRRLGALSERSTGIPGWASLPLTILGGSLIVAVFGMYWDISTHLDAGRDPGPFANASHYFILVGLFGVVFAGLLAITLPDDRPGPAAIHLPFGLHAPLGGSLILLCGLIALSGFPLDDIWHRLFGQDVTLWGPTHLLLFGGASLSVLAGLILFEEGRRARGRQTNESGDRARHARRGLAVSLCGALLIGASTIQGEYDFAVPQFRLVLHPILLMIAAGFALVLARMYLGRGGALAAVGVFLLMRGLLTLLVSPGFGHTTLHFPLYLAEAVLIELVALRVDPRRTLRFGLAAGAAVGTVGLAAEWAWSYIWWTIEWPASLLPEAVLAGFISAVAAAVLGAYAGRALTASEPGRLSAPRFAAPIAAVAAVGVLIWAVPATDGPKVAADVRLAEVVPGGPEREVHLSVRLDPPDAAEDARWFVTTAWQGKEGRSVVDPLRRIGPGLYQSTEPLPVHGNWKSSIRLHTGSALLALPVYFPADPAIPTTEIPVGGQVRREFIEDRKLLQREQKPGVSGALTTIGYLTVLLIAAGLAAALALGLRRIGQKVHDTPTSTGAVVLPREARR